MAGWGVIAAGPTGTATPVKMGDMLTVRIIASRGEHRTTLKNTATRTEVEAAVADAVRQHTGATACAFSVDNELLCMGKPLPHGVPLSKFWNPISNAVVIQNWPVHTTREEREKERRRKIVLDASTQQYTATAQQCEPEVAEEFFTNLDVLEFNIVPYLERLDLLALSATNKAIRAAIRGTVKFFQAITVDKLGPVDGDHLRRFIAAQTSLRSLVVSTNVHLITDDFLIAVASTAHDLESLRIGDDFAVKMMLIGLDEEVQKEYMPCTEAGLTAIVQGCPRLIALSLSCCRNISIGFMDSLPGMLRSLCFVDTTECNFHNRRPTEYTDAGNEPPPLSTMQWNVSTRRLGLEVMPYRVKFEGGSAKFHMLVHSEMTIRELIAQVLKVKRNRNIVPVGILKAVPGLSAAPPKERVEPLLLPPEATMVELGINIDTKLMCLLSNGRLG